MNNSNLEQMLPVYFLVHEEYLPPYHIYCLFFANCNPHNFVFCYIISVNYTDCLCYINKVTA